MADLAWQELYKAALLELRPEELRRTIEAAEAAMHQQLQELEKVAGGSNEEHHAISDALRNLRMLTKAECKPLACFTMGTSAHTEVAS